MGPLSPILPGGEKVGAVIGRRGWGAAVGVWEEVERQLVNGMLFIDVIVSSYMHTIHDIHQSLWYGFPECKLLHILLSSLNARWRKFHTCTHSSGLWHQSAEHILVVNRLSIVCNKVDEFQVCALDWKWIFMVVALQNRGWWLCRLTHVHLCCRAFPHQLQAN